MHLKWKPIKTDGFDSLLTQLHWSPCHFSHRSVYMCVYNSSFFYPHCFTRSLQKYPIFILISVRIHIKSVPIKTLIFNFKPSETCVLYKNLPPFLSSSKSHAVICVCQWSISYVNGKRALEGRRHLGIDWVLTWAFLH